MLYRSGNVVGALIAQTLAVAVMFATMLLGYSSGQGPGVTYRYQAADVVVQVSPTRVLGMAPDMVPEQFEFRIPPVAIQELRAIDGLAAVIPDRTFAAQIIGQDGRPIVVPGYEDTQGQSWSVVPLTPFRLTDGMAPVGEGEIVVDRAIAEQAELHVGDEVQVITHEGPGMYRIVGIAVPPTGDALPRQTSIFFVEETVNRLVPPAQGVPAAGIFIGDNADRTTAEAAIAAIAGQYGLEVLTGPDRGRADVTTGKGELKDLGMLFLVQGMFIGFVSIFVIGSTLSFAIQQRAREIAVQRAIGFTPGQIRRRVALEAAIIGLTGGVAGIGLGTVIAAGIIGVMHLASRAPSEFSLHFWNGGVVVVLLASLTISQMAVWVAGKRAAAIRPTMALRESSASQRWFSPGRTLLGLLLVSGAVACLSIAPSADTEGAIGLSLVITMCATTGIAALSPVLVRLGSGLLLVLLGRRLSTTTRLALRNCRARAARGGAVVGAVVLSLGFATLIACFNATLEAGVAESMQRALQADLHVLPENSGLPAGSIEAMRSIDSVEAVSGVYGFSAMYQFQAAPGEREATDVAVSAVDGSSLAAMLDVTFMAGDWSALERGESVVAQEFATGYGLQVGTTWILTMPDMTGLEIKVGAILEQPVANADVLLPASIALPHLVDPAMSEMLVKIVTGADLKTVIASIEEHQPGKVPLLVIGKDEYIEALNVGLRENAWAANLIIGGAAAFAGVAVINTVVMSTSERRREFTRMRLIGSLRQQVLQMVRGESLFIAMLGVVLGVGIGVLSAVAVSIGLVGDASALVVPVSRVGVYGTVTMAVIVCSAAIPARLRTGEGESGLAAHEE